MAIVKLQGKNFKTAALCCCGNCVAVSQENGEILVADTKNPQTPPLRFNKQEWQDFTNAVKAGEFDI